MQDTMAAPVKESILVIQPDLAERRILQLVFNGRYILYFAAEVDRAIRINRNFHCKVVVFDAGTVVPHALTDVSRFKAANEMESPIILIASNNSFEIEKKVADIGVFYHLIRPYSVKDLEELIEAALCYWQRIFGWTRVREKVQK